MPDFFWKALKIPPLSIGAFLSGLIHKVDHIELFAASSGSSILNVLGTQRHGFVFIPAYTFASLEYFPDLGELLPEHLLLPMEDEGDKLPADPTN